MTMAKLHRVKQGETLSSIARDHGFRNFHTIFDHPNNAALRAMRDPHVLFPGDQLFIPDLQPATVERATEDSHRFVLQSSRLLLRLRLLDVNGRPLANTACDVGLDPGKAPDLEITDAQGTLEKPLEVSIREGEVTAHIPSAPTPAEPAPPPGEQKVKFDLKIGRLNPESKLSGQQARLNNLGYFAGFTLKDLDQVLWAAEEFACDRLSKPVTRRPRITPAPPGGEDDETASDPGTPTGITDEPIVRKLRREHGI
jgi:hypothetical protein